MSEKSMAIFGWVGTTISVLMYVSYIPQIMNNLHGVKGSPVQPFVAAINGVIWVSYALLKAKKDFPLAAANAPGIIFGLITGITAIL